jgi:YbbR domain-containing protein
MTNKPIQKTADGKMTQAAKITALVGSILGALLLWIYAIGYDSTLFESTFDGVAVVLEGEEALSESKGFTLAEGQNFSSITVVAKGKRSELNELKSTDFRAVVDVSQVTGAGNQTLNIIVYSPNGIEIVSQSSTTVNVFVDEFTQRTELLSVSVDTGDKYVMTDGVTFISAVANPLSISVSGPKSVLDTVDSASVRFNLDGKEIKNNLYGYGAIELRNKNGEVINNPYLTLSDSTAYVTVSVKKQKTVPVRVAFNGGAFSSSDATVETSVQSILISGFPDAIDALNEIVLTVDETKISGSGTFEFAVSGLLPKDVHNESNVSRITVKVTLPKLSTRSYVIKKDKITVKNLPVGYGSELNNEITVKLIGVREVLDKIDMNLISASLDFDRVTVEANGTYTAEAEISLGGEYSGVYIQNTDHKVNFSVFAE